MIAAHEKWLANNWQEIPLPTNPGGHQIVAYVGLAAPVLVDAPVDRPAERADAVQAGRIAGSADRMGAGGIASAAVHRRRHGDV